MSDSGTLATEPIFREDLAEAVMSALRARPRVHHLHWGGLGAPVTAVIKGDSQAMSDVWYGIKLLSEVGFAGRGIEYTVLGERGTALGLTGLKDPVHVTNALFHRSTGEWTVPPPGKSWRVRSILEPLIDRQWHLIQVTALTYGREIGALVEHTKTGRSLWVRAPSDLGAEDIAAQIAAGLAGLGAITEGHTP